MASKKSRGSGRTRNFACTVYLDSAPKDWYDILVSHKVPAFVSPYHDKDFNEKKSEEGEPIPKKPHFHVMLMFDSVKTPEQAEEIFNTINGVGLEIINSVRGYARYLCHLDNPEKAQYPVEDVRSLYGAEYLNVIGLAIDKYNAIREMMEFVKNNCVWSYAELLDYCAVHKQDWFRCLCDNGSYVMKEYIKSAYWKSKVDRARKSDDETLPGMYMDCELNSDFYDG